MKGRVIVLGQTRASGRSVAGLVTDGHLEDIIIGPPSREDHPQVGDIRDATVTRKLPKSGAFCTFEGKGSAYLRDARDVSEGDRVRVQVSALPEHGKAVTVTTRLLFKGPRLIVTPGAPGVNVSRAIGNSAERARLEGIVTAELTDRGSVDTGVIVRTAARGEDPQYLVRELRWLFEAAARGSVEDVDPTHGAGLRTWLFPLPDEILCTPEIADTVGKGAPEAGPAGFWGDDRLLARLKADADPLTSSGVRDAMNALRDPAVSLARGSAIWIEATRAIVAVDVDTGADMTPAAGLKSNLDTARTLPRQLRLRGLGGQIAIDFAPMPKQHRKTVEEALRKAFRDDPIETSLIGWTKMGLFELQRKRERPLFAFGDLE